MQPLTLPAAQLQLGWGGNRTTQGQLGTTSLHIAPTQPFPLLKQPGLLGSQAVAF